MALIKAIGLDKNRAQEAQRIGAMPDNELAKAFALARKEARLLHYGELIVRARPLLVSICQQAIRATWRDDAGPGLAGPSLPVAGRALAIKRPPRWSDKGRLSRRPFLYQANSEMSLHGTFETCRGTLRISVYWGRLEAAARRPK
jgi:hypothetical protein